jgi:hypothetical protein
MISPLTPLLLQLPIRETRDYYKQFLRSGFIAHQKESDPELIAILHQKALADADWILSKYSSPSSSPTDNNTNKKKST